LLARALSRSPELRQRDGRALAEEVKALRGRRRGDATAAPEMPVAPPPPPSDPGEELPLVGRDAEFAAAGEALTRLRRRQGGVVLVEGGPGSGKSRFLRDVGRAAASLGLASIRCECGASRSEPYAA